jgi:hypothetical protein
MGRLVIHGHSHSPVPFAGRYPSEPHLLRTDIRPAWFYHNIVIRVPILATLSVDPDITRIHRSRRSGGRDNSRDGWIRADIEFIRSNPVSGDGLLGLYSGQVVRRKPTRKVSLRADLLLGRSKVTFGATPARDF